VTATAEPLVDAADILARAQAMAATGDPKPEHFRDNLDVLVQSMNEQAGLNERGSKTALGMLTVAARNRIEVDAYAAAHPDIDAAPLDAPIFLSGLPRSGTTYFQYLFDQDERLRMLRTWEGERPSPPPALYPDSARQRLQESREAQARLRALTGNRIDAMHLTDVEGPQECLAILDQTFVNPGLLWTMAVPGYFDHLLHRADLVAAYQHHARVLRLLQAGTQARRWALKWPCHLLALDAILEVHPSAKVVMTHRDPVQALASNCSLTKMLRAGTSTHAAPDEIGRDMLALIGEHVNRLVEFDRRHSDVTVHVDYYRLVDAPEQVMPDVFAALDLEWTSSLDAAIRRWREENPKGKRGAHEYSLEEYGLSRGEIAEVFAEYIQRFDIPSEEARS
jgi:hypothetical protein